ncbi:unnamed protein product [Cuscuta europaea]|uniref:DUF7725 domain-containing protein n=1 Tax=Cuscuta europaea TaxID=41803 RepID=A0A9P0ZSM4_CUSEU|nr:unnamed protein product [Cuscuta europaea]
MDAAAGVVAARGAGIPLPVSSPQASRKEWRAVPEQSLRNSTSEIDRSKLGQSDERLIYEVQHGREPADVDFCSIAIDGSPDSDLLHQRLHTVAKQRDELQQMEIELQAQIITRSQIMELRKVFEAEVKEQANANMKYQEQLRERDQKIFELERRIEEKERELQAVRLDNEAAWAKEDLLREQNKELQTYRRERDNSEAERAQNIKQIHELQEHIQEKERQLVELQEQNRIAKETISYKDEQMREAQAWMSRAQDFIALQQAELRERAEQYNQLWLGSQRQFGEMEHMHLRLQQLQIEVTEAKERNSTSTDCSQASKETAKDTSQHGLEKGNGHNESASNGGCPANSGHVPNGNAETALALSSFGNLSTQNDAHGVPLAPSSLLGMPTFIQPGQIAESHPYLVHQQGVPSSVPTQIPQSHHLGHFHSVPAVPSFQHWPNQQVSSEGASLMSIHSQYHLQTESVLLTPDSNFEYEASINGKVPLLEIEPKASVGASHAVEQQFVGENCTPSLQTEQYTLQHISTQFHDVLRLDQLEHSNEFQGNDLSTSDNHGVKSGGVITGEVSATSDNKKSSPEVPDQISHLNDKVTDATQSNAACVPEKLICGGQKNAHAVAGKVAEPDSLLGEQALLACIVRTIPPGSSGRIRISTTLPNRLAKMLSPLHWHDYKKKFGKLDDFVASHPELFVIDEDYIQLREGAQEIIAATSAAAKVAAAAAAAAATSSSYPLHLPSVAVTPMAPSQRMKILMKPKNSADLSASRSSNGSSSVQFSMSEGIKDDKNDLSPRKGASSWKPASNLAGKQQERISRFPPSSRR